MATQSSCHMIKRAIWLAICASALAGLWFIAHIWGSLAGQSVYRLSAADDAMLSGGLADMAEKCEVSTAAFAMRDTQEGIRLYECAAYHPEAFGIVLVKGVPVTEKHIDSCAKVVMLNVDGATAISPGLDCIGRQTVIDGEEYTIIGIYDDSAYAGAFTRTASASAIIPAARSGEVRTWYVWTKGDEDNVFAYQQAGNMLKGLHGGMDAGSFQAEAVSESMLAGVQRCRFITLAVLAILCAGLIRHTRGWRGAFVEKTKAGFRAEYALRAALISVRPFVRYILPIAAALLAAAAFAVYCAANIHIGVGSIPEKLLDMDQWLELWQRRIMETNAYGQLPVYAVNLNGWLSRFAWGAGITAMVGAAFGVAGGRKDR